LYTIRMYSYSLRLCYFFFSSRRRHTRFSRDWSSDVCSSDLVRHGFELQRREERTRTARHDEHRREEAYDLRLHRYRPPRRLPGRSEERRVGKEGRTRWPPDMEKKKERIETNAEANRIHTQRG